MSVAVKQTKRRGIFYGWWVVVGATIVQALNGGVYYYGFSTFYAPLIKEFGWSSTALSGAMSLSRLEAGIAAPLVGFLVDRIGPRRLMLIGFLMVGLGFIFVARVESILMLYVVFILLLSMGASLGFQLPATSTVAKWFVRRRGMALGIAMCGVGIGGMFALPLLGLLIEQYGWRNAATGIGVLFLVTGVPLALLMRSRPEPYGYLPDGDPPARDTDSGQENAAEVEIGGNGQRSLAAGLTEVSFSAREAVRSRTFWLFAISAAFRTFVATGTGVHLIPALQSLDYPLPTAALIAGIMLALSVLPRLAIGWLGDRFDLRRVTGACMFLQFLSLVAMAYAGNLAMVVVFLLAYAPGYGGGTTLTPAIWGAYYGRQSFGAIYGLGQAVTQVGTVLGPLTVGYIFDVTGQYQGAFLLLAAASLVGIVPLLFVGKPQAKHAKS